MIFALLLQLPPFRNSDPGSHSGHFPPPITVHAFILIAARVEHSLPWSTRVELCVHTLGALSSHFFLTRAESRGDWYS